MESGRGHINAEAAGDGVSGSVGCVNNTPQIGQLTQYKLFLTVLEAASPR